MLLPRAAASPKTVTTYTYVATSRYLPASPNNTMAYCPALLNDGRWLDSPIFLNWQPPGCMLHSYKRPDIQACFSGQKIVLIGDSTTRQIFWAIAKKLRFNTSLDAGKREHENLKFEDPRLEVQFVWDPFLNSTTLYQELGDFRDGKTGLVLVAAPGLWNARYGDWNESEPRFKEAVDQVMAYMPQMEHSSRPDQEPQNLLVMAPVQMIGWEALTPARGKTITPRKIQQMNQYLRNASTVRGLGNSILWSYSSMVDGEEGQLVEGLHVVENIALRQADILLNLRCNIVSQSYPYNRTCCNQYPATPIAIWLLGVFSLIFAMAIGYHRCRRQLTNPGNSVYLNIRLDVIGPICLLPTVFFYSYIADRTQMFEKSQKQFKAKDFAIGCILITGIGCFSRRSTSPRSGTIAPAIHLDPGFLNRDQTNEWKGWMQAFILLYHYTGASSVLPIYEVTRVLVASYLFLTGYGHTLYFLRRGDYSLQRFASVLLRLNFLSMFLPWIMSTSYQFYYFAPLVSFWFIIIYVTLWAGKDYDLGPWFILGKMLVSALFVRQFTLNDKVLENVEWLCHVIGIRFEAVEWKFRTALDMYIVYVGMGIALLVHCYNFQKLTAQSRNRKVFLIASCLIILIYFGLAQQFPTKESYNNVFHPYFSSLPVVAYIFARNSTKKTREQYSKAFAWLGKISLETYVLQYHIWLAGDATGRLRSRLHLCVEIEAVVLGVLFLMASWGAAKGVERLEKLVFQQKL